MRLDPLLLFFGGGGARAPDGFRPNGWFWLEP